MKRLNQTESPIFVILNVLCFQRQSFFTFIFLCSGFSSALSSFLCYITVFLIIYVSLCCFTDEVEDPYADRSKAVPLLKFFFLCASHYENTPIQIYSKFHLQKLKIFR